MTSKLSEAVLSAYEKYLHECGVKLHELTSKEKLKWRGLYQDWKGSESGEINMHYY